jgi:hypothetical protein
VIEMECLCQLKDNEEKLITEGYWINLYIYKEYGEYFIKALSDGRADMKIDYCPKCGRKLEEVEPEEEFEW